MFVTFPPRPSPALTGFLPSPAKPFPFRVLRTLVLDRANNDQARPAKSAACALFSLPLTPCTPKNPSISRLFKILHTLGKKIAGTQGLYLQTLCRKKSTRGLLNSRFPFSSLFLHSSQDKFNHCNSYKKHRDGYPREDSHFGIPVCPEARVGLPRGPKAKDNKGTIRPSNRKFVLLFARHSPLLLPFATLFISTSPGNIA